MTELTFPSLNSCDAGSLHALEEIIATKRCQVEAFFREQWRQTPAPLYASCDLRNAGFKISPVDTNLFPAGFNNLNPKFLPLAIQAVSMAVESLMPGCKRILLVPENHTRNTFYFESITTLQEILEKAGYETRVGSVSGELSEPLIQDLPSGRRIHLEPASRQGDMIVVNGFTPCSVILNHDLSGGMPPLLEGIMQPVYPPVKLGWGDRLKSTHFGFFQDVVQEFAQQLEIDPWLLNPMFSQCEGVDFQTGDGMDCLIDKTTELFDAIRAKYKEYGINHDPFVVVKADAGTYGMGVLMIKDPQELTKLNRKDRNRMGKTKGASKIDKVILQEGVFSFETWGEDNAVAEPVIYMFGQNVIGGFYRIHQGRGVDENLNAPGMQFEPLAFSEVCNNPDLSSCGSQQNRLYVYGVVARLALVAASREKAEVKQG